MTFHAQPPCAPIGAARDLYLIWPITRTKAELSVAALICHSSRIATPHKQSACKQSKGLWEVWSWPKVWATAESGTMRIVFRVAADLVSGGYGLYPAHWHNWAGGVITTCGTAHTSFWHAVSLYQATALCTCLREPLVACCMLGHIQDNMGKLNLDQDEAT